MATNPTNSIRYLTSVVELLESQHKISMVISFFDETDQHGGSGPCSVRRVGSSSGSSNIFDVDLYVI